jgi:hypothetical protein
MSDHLAITHDEHQVAHYDANATRPEDRVREASPSELATPCHSSDRTITGLEQDVQGEEKEKTSNPIDREGFRYIPQPSSSTIWVEFSPNSSKDPLNYRTGKKYFITCIAAFFTLCTSFNASSYAMGEGSMERDLNATRTQAATGLSLFAWGFAVFPVILAPFSEE